jgi:transglutaminase-like putative cysteine protease
MDRERERERAEAAPPPLAVLAALALWGWQAELLPWAVMLGLLIEAARWAPLGFDIGQEDFNRLWNFTTLLFIGVALYLFLAREGLSTVGGLVTAEPGGRLEGLRQLSQTAVTFVRWLPLILVPFALVQAWSRTQKLPWTTFSLYLRARERRGRTEDRARTGNKHTATERKRDGGIHFGYVFLTAVLFASCAAVTHPVAYLPWFVGVAGYALWRWRNPRYGAPVWIGLMVVLLVGAGAAQHGLVRLRGWWQDLENRLMQRAGEGELDQLRSVTALGAVGRLKQSGSIVLRIRTTDDAAPPLLREAAFNRFRGPVWGAARRSFEVVTPAIEGVLWRFSAQRGGAGSLEVARFTTQGEAPLALPADVLAIRELAASVVETNYLSAARLRFGPPLVVYTVERGPGGGFDGAPDPDDTDLAHLAEPDREAVESVARGLGLIGMTPRQAVAAVQRHFATQFEYALWQRHPPGQAVPSPLATFLRETRAGHCEYFATATALLLRTAGLPTRYAVGYSASERRGDQWIARGRDAHAWCLAFVGGRWAEVDTTPGVWRERERAEAGWWEGLRDGLSQAWFRFALWRQQGGNWRIHVFAASMVALGWLAWRQLRGSRWRRARATSATAGQALRPSPGLDSEFYAVAKQWERLRGARLPGETLPAWVQRLGLGQGAQAPSVHELVCLHYRLRFDPHGLPPDERARLRRLASEST